MNVLKPNRCFPDIGRIFQITAELARRHIVRVSPVACASDSEPLGQPFQVLCTSGGSVPASTSNSLLLGPLTVCPTETNTPHPDRRPAAKTLSKTHT